MAKINKVELNLGQKIANPFKTTRKSDTNPFKYSNFEGNTLQFADVFEGFEPKKISKLKMISASVIGSITKLHNSITEPIINFVNRIIDRVSNAWTYAKNTNIEISGLKEISEKVHNILNYDVSKGISDSVSGIGKSITSSVTEISNGISEKWSKLINKINIGKIGHEKISSDLPVADLKTLWLRENELILNQKSAKEIALNHEHKMEEKVA